MSDSENFLTRWSRRKREVAGEQASADQQVSPPATCAPRAADVPAEQARPAAADTSEPLVDLSKLPSIESITAETDISGFLARGVPAELKAAALRRVWVADPKIRDFVGLNDYDFDFHTPGAIPGFGPLEMTDELRREVSRIVGDLVSEPEPAPPAAAASPSGTLQPTAATAETNAEPGAPPISRLANCDADDQTVTPEETREDALGSPSNKEVAASQHTIERSENLPTTARRGHGRALPQ